jgi:hypothetical protein
MKSSGKLTISGQDLEVFLNESDIDRLLKSVKGEVLPQPEPPKVDIPVALPPIVQVPITPSDGEANIVGHRPDMIDGYVISLKVGDKTPNEISWDNVEYYKFDVIRQQPNVKQTYYIKTGSKITEILVDTSNSTPTINGRTPVILAPPIVNSPIVTKPIVPSNGSFNPTGQGLTRLAVGKRYLVPDRNEIQMASHSFGQRINGNQYINGLQTYLKQDGKLLMYFDCSDNDFLRNGGQANNNHTKQGKIVIGQGSVEMGYRNNTERDFPIVLGVEKIENNEGYLFYKKQGHLTKANFFKVLKKGESIVTTFDVNTLSGYSNVTEYRANTLSKHYTLNFHINGKLCVDDIELSSDFGSDVWWNINETIKAGKETTFCYRSRQNKGSGIKVKFEGLGYGNTGYITVLEERGGMHLVEELVRISSYNFNDMDGTPLEGRKSGDYKQFCNAGNVNYETLTYDAQGVEINN